MLQLVNSCNIFSKYSSCQLGLTELNDKLVYFAKLQLSVLLFTRLATACCFIFLKQITTFFK